MSLLQMSIYGGVLILVITLVRALLLDRLPKRTFVILWGVVLLRLLLPFSFSSAFSVYSLLGAGHVQREEPPVHGAGQDAGEPLTSGQDAGEPLVLGQGGGEPFGYGAGNDAPEGQAAFSQEPGVLPQRALPLGAGEFSVQAAVRYLVSGGEGLSQAPGKGFSLPQVVWGAGALLCAALFAVVYLRSVRNFRTALPMEDAYVDRWVRWHRLCRPISVRQSDRIAVPLTYGIFRPVIVMPKKQIWEQEQELEYVLQHEYVHILCWDSGLKLAMAAALCLHWFNPLVWAMAGFLGRDIELACDEGVLCRFGENARADYALALIGMEEKKGGGACFYNGFSKNAGKNAIEERIKSIMRYKKRTVITLLAAALLVSSVAVVFATSAQEDGTAGGDRGGAGGNMADGPSKGSSGIYWYGGTDTSTGVSHYFPAGPAAGNAGGTAQYQPADGAVGGENDGDGNYRIVYWIEGMPEEEPAELYTGAGYSILIPSAGWKQCAPDAWQSEADPSVWLWVTDFGARTRGEVAKSLVEKGYAVSAWSGVAEPVEGSDEIKKLRELELVLALAEERGNASAGSGKTMSAADYDAVSEVIKKLREVEQSLPGGMKKASAENGSVSGTEQTDDYDAVFSEIEKLKKVEEDRVLFVELRRQIVEGGTENTWGIYYTGPADAEEGYLARLAKLASGFQLVPAKSAEELPEDGSAAASLLTSFWQAYLSGDKEAVRQYLTADYSDEIECFPEGVDGYAADVQVYAMKGLDIDGKKEGDRCVVSVEFRLSPQTDSLTYLTAELVKEQDGWKVCWYGLEG